jgi:hypothetical protein
MANILKAICNIAEFRNNDLRGYATTYLNRINAAGEQFEFYIKDSIVGSFSKSLSQKEQDYAETFSYLGNQNNPPDMIIKNSDAFEVKKIESPMSSLALNSSFPKDTLHSTDPRIIESCKRCDGGNWSKKDLFYVVGCIKGGAIKYIIVVHGLCYAADKSVYEKLHKPLKQEVSKIISLQGLQTSQTVELGKVKRADPLGITTLRIRGMWDIENPLKVFASVITFNREGQFSFYAIMKKEKYDSFPQEDIANLQKISGIGISEIKLKDPNNPANIFDGKLIKLSW